MIFGWGGNGFGGNRNAGTVSVNIPAIVRNQCCDSTSTLTLVITSATVPATVTIDNTAVVVTKI